MRCYRAGFLSLIIFAAGGVVLQAVASDGDVSSGVGPKPTAAPAVTCTVKMNNWCIIQADAGLNMIESGRDRIWRLTAPDSSKELVVIRESKACDTPTDIQPRKNYEREERSSSGEIHNVMEFYITSDKACVLKVKYLAGGTESALEAVQFAKNRIYLCAKGLCNRPLLKVL